jgi:hypothetical protein
MGDPFIFPSYRQFLVERLYYNDNVHKIIKTPAIILFAINN